MKRSMQMGCSTSTFWDFLDHLSRIDWLVVFVFFSCGMPTIVWNNRWGSSSPIRNVHALTTPRRQQIRGYTNNENMMKTTSLLPMKDTSRNNVVHQSTTHDVVVDVEDDQDLSSGLPTPKPKHGKNRRKKVSTHSKTPNSNQKIPTVIPRLSDILEGRSTVVYNAVEQKDAPKPRLPTKTSTPRKQSISKIPTTTPWRASYKSSTRTQGRIKKMFSTVTSESNNIPPSRRARRILDELLQTPPHFCNAVNLVCALTYSAKVMGQQQVHQNPDQALRKSLQKTLDVLHDLVVVHKEEQLLSARQLCNVCWAIAKHYDRDPMLLPQVPLQVVKSSDMIIMGDSDSEGPSWQWNTAPLMKEEELVMNSTTDSPEARLQETIDEIAIQLASVLSRDDKDGTNMNESSFRKPRIKRGEICMACWAYGKLKPREVPPGWPGPPQVGKVIQTSNFGGANDDVGMPLIKFEQLGRKGLAIGDNTEFSINDDRSNDSLEKSTVTDALFDAFAQALTKTPEVPDESMNSLSLLQQCTWSELANIGWAFASHGQCRSEASQNLLVTLADEASFRLKESTSARFAVDRQKPMIRDITQLLWSLGTLQADNFQLADGLVSLVNALTESLRLGEKTGSSFSQGRPLRRWSCADLVQTAVALAHARIDEQRLLRAVYEEGTHRLMEGSSNINAATSFGSIPADERRSFHPWEASILLWAQARLYLTGQQDPVFDEFVEDAPAFFLKTLRENGGSFFKSHIGPQEQANIVWALVVLEKFNSNAAVELIDMIFQESARSCKEDKTIQLEHAHQLWQAYFILEEDCPEAVERVPKWFVTYLREKWSLEKARDKVSSARHRSLSSTLQLMGVDHINEHDEDIDVAIILKPNAAWIHETEMDQGMESTNIDKMSLAVEFDGPNHFTRRDDWTSDRPRALGHTVLKYRLLKKQGWTVVRVPYYEFDKIPFWASMERQRYLQRKLKTHANLRFSDVDVSEYKALIPNRRSRYD
ncbi:RAP domain containing protein [Nitzschia inconspicua]|uniref:RAP domain containing protein n=1 Tax=Nitzschia inconspicua TaxID=303405 RepID=A0A9K3L9F8_9STRA|nr:RAP domain containing protein [Nitzschia inconspicua]